MVMETKLGRLPKEIDREGLEVIHYKAEYRDRDIRTVTSAAISKDGRQVALSFENGDIEVVDIDRQHTLTRFQCDSRSPLVWIVILDSHRIATEDDEGNIFTFDYGPHPDSQITNHYDYWNRQLVKFGTLPSGHRPPVTAVADDASFIVRLPRHLGPNWQERVVILYLSGEPSIHVLSSPSSMPTAVPTRPPPIPVGLTVELSPGGRYVVACDANRDFIWSTKSREFIASHHLPDSETFTSHPIPSRTYIISGARRPPTLGSEHGIDNIGDFTVERDLDKLWLESQPHTYSLEVLARRQAYSLNRTRIGTPNPELWLNNTLKLILPIEYHPIILNNDYPREWYGDRVIGDEDFIYFPHASKDGTRFLVQGRMRAPIVVDISQIV
ncbi:uncharacterized protein EI90DRAFT_3129243 [Cantharellus anzutake]|uniref:uncharacterized protein n=1 Tax=Cantharellus anzutake TaxID=1750568 RepID=UPI001902F62E|nr:uncharacterized protein EI90DRAFT_3129243 [Cantharellus anzutake]KAF8324965.1 hypothetical protein EI90DRAFT_3129243 [Cantharellus anzutake]